MRPEIGFKGFADEWEQHKLSEICDFEKGKGLSKDDISDNGKYPCILYGQLFTEYGMFINSIFSKSNTISDECKLSEKGDILIPRCDTTPDGLGRASALSVNNVILGFDINILKIKNKKDYNFNYVSVALNFHRKDLLSMVVGSTVRHLENKELRDILIESPCSIEEQKKIASLFQCIENLITLHQRKYERLVNVKRSMLVKMFPQNSSKVPEIRFKGFTNDWEQRKLGEITELKSASRVHRDEWTGSGVPFFRSSDVMAAINGTVNEKAYISEELYEKLSSVSGKLEKGDVLITGGGSVGNPYIVPDNEPLYTKDADLLWIKNQGRFHPYFLYEYFFSPTFRTYLGSISHVGTIAHYTITQLSETPICLPNIEEQTKVGEYFSNLDHLITLHQCKIKKLQDAKKAFLIKMFA